MKKFILYSTFIILVFLIAGYYINTRNIIYSNNNDSLEISDTIEEITYGAKRPGMYNIYEKEFTIYQFDSICKADKLLKDLNKWHQLKVKDGETHEEFIEYMYIKSYNRNYDCIYRLVKVNNNIYKITKREKIR